jgi:hypothetical protein
VRRLAVVLLLLYFAVLMDAGSNVFLDPVNGVFSAGIGTMLFPIPTPGSRMLPAYVPLSQIDVLVYTIFLYQGIWAAWLLLATAYILLPLILWIFKTSRRLGLDSAQVSQMKKEQVGVLTSAMVGFSIVLSVATFSFPPNLWNYGPIPLVVVLGLSATMIATILYDLQKRLQRSNQ